MTYVPVLTRCLFTEDTASSGYSYLLRNLRSPNSRFCLNGSLNLFFTKDEVTRLQDLRGPPETTTSDLPGTPSLVTLLSLSTHPKPLHSCRPVTGVLPTTLVEGVEEYELNP